MVLRLVMRICLFVGIFGLAWNVQAADDSNLFESRIRPVLIERCEGCHSTAKGKTKGGLALDSKAGWEKGGDSGPAIVPGNPEESLLLRAVRYTDESLQMPPKGEGKRLTDAELADFERWVSQGAIDPRVAKSPSLGMTAEESRTWWSFQPLQDVTPPAASTTWNGATEIDHFIAAKWNENHLTPTRQADRRTLLRRASLILTGLPPTPRELTDFESDASPLAWQRVIDRLLASPAYGERWARHWLDVVRYADFYDANPQTRTASCEITEAWRYRDWVVTALNGDMPYDRFVAMQIAGDLLPDDTGKAFHPAGLVATTFLTNGVWDRGDADKEKIVSDMVDDNIDTVGKVFLGLTLGCARCHDHKFDPITTEDYYALAGIFYSSHLLADLGVKGGEYTMNRVPLLSPEQMAVRTEQTDEIARVSRQIAILDAKSRVAAWGRLGAIVKPTAVQSEVGATATVSEDGNVLITGNQGKDRYSLIVPTPTDASIRTVRIDALPHETLPAGGPGRSSDGNFVLTKVTIVVPSKVQGEPDRVVKVSGVRASFSQVSFGPEFVLDEKSESGWAVSPMTGEPHSLLIEIPPDADLPRASELRLVLEMHHTETHQLGHFRIAIATETLPAGDDESEDKQRFVSRRNELKAALDVPVPLAIAIQEGGTPGGLFSKIQDVPIHIRGSYTRLGPVVPRRFPRRLAGDNQPPLSTGSGRRELAAWVTQRENPLFARVIVNRVWQWHFGEGLVRTPSNFGKLGERPTHPELLDWLATQFIADGWSLKKLHRRLMMSAVWQFDSKTSPEQLESDPENRWLSRFAPRRLEAEAIRDCLLSVSGGLRPSTGGPAGDDLTIPYRSLYVQTARWDRSSYAMLFDASNPDASTEKRVVSTVAPQALLLLNHPYFQAQAEQLARRLIESSPDNDQRIEHAYRWLFLRAPTESERSIARDLVAGSAEQQLANWTDLAHVLICSNEFVYLE